MFEVGTLMRHIREGQKETVIEEGARIDIEIEKTGEKIF